MAIYSVSTFNYSVSQTLKDQFSAGVIPIITPYADAGYVTNDFAHTPPLPGNIYPPTSGVYTTQRTWTDLTQAQACIASINAWLDANAECKQFTAGPTVVQE